MVLWFSGSSGPLKELCDDVIIYCSWSKVLLGEKKQVNIQTFVVPLLIFMRNIKPVLQKVKMSYLASTFQNLIKQWENIINCVCASREKELGCLKKKKKKKKRFNK